MILVETAMVAPRERVEGVAKFVGSTLHLSAKHAPYTVSY